MGPVDLRNVGLTDWVYVGRTTRSLRSISASRASEAAF